MIRILANEHDMLKFQDYLDKNGRNSRIERIESHKADKKDYFLVFFSRSVGSYYPSFEDLLDKKKSFYTIPEIKNILEKDAKREFYASGKEERFTENQIKLMYDPNVPDEVLIEKKLMILNGLIDIFHDKLGEELKTASYDNIKRIVYTLVENRTEDFVKTLLSIEKGIKDEKTLKFLYNEYMDNDGMQLLDSNFDHLLENLEEMTLHQTQEIAKIKI